MTSHTSRAPWRAAAFIALASMGLADCRLGSAARPKPGGQVVATVGDRKVSLQDLAAAAPARPGESPTARKAAETAALRDIVGRDLIADAARREGLDRTATFIRARDHLVDALLVEAYQAKVAAGVQPPTPGETQQFIDQHPDSFAQRKVFDVEQLQMARPSDPELARAMAGTTSLDQIAALLTQKKIPFQRDSAKLDAATADPGLANALAHLPPGQLFVLPEGRILSINRIDKATVIPFTGPAAIARAQTVLRAEKTRTALQTSIRGLFAKDSGEVKFAKGYEAADPATASTPPG
jgi:EpsD family peptidyl-prolyl cis-trans isomerase